MGLLCIYLFWTGGTQGTGPIYYLVFPVVAVFLNGFLAGAIYIFALSVITIIIYLSSSIGFNKEIYDVVFLIRIATVYVITSFLSVFYSYFKFISERELLFIHDDLEQLSFADLKTGLANKKIMERLLNSEFKRYKRYGAGFSLLLISVDGFAKVRSQYGQEAAEMLVKAVSEVIQLILRDTDVPSLWGREEFLVLMPQTNKIEADVVAERIRSGVAKQKNIVNGQTLDVTVSIGLIEVEDEGLSELVQKLDFYLSKAIKQSGNSVVSY